MNNFSKIILLFFVFIPLAFGLGSITIKSIDEITNNTGTDIILKPVNDVKIDTFAGNFVLQSGSLKEIEQSSITNLELSYLTGLTSNAQSQITANVSPTTTLGDIISRGASVDERLAVGTIGQVLTSDGSIPQWEDAAGGVGGINFITNFDFELDASGWNQYNDGAVSVPIDCTGATGNGNTLARNTTLPLYQTGDLKFVKAAVTDNKGTGFSTDFTIGNGYQTQMLTTEMLLDSTDAALDDGDMKFFIYDVTNAKLVGDTAGYDLLAGKPSQIFQWQASPDSTSYRFCAHVVTTETPPFVLRLDNITINQKSIAKAPVVTDSVAYTPTVTGYGAGSGTATGQWFQVGQFAHISVKTVKDGTPGIASAFIGFSMPPGLVIDGSKKIGASSVGYINASAGTFHTQGYAIADTGSNQILSRNSGTVNNIDGGDMFAGSTLTIEVIVPIVGWSSNAQTSETLSGREIVARGVGNSGSAQTVNVTNIDFTETEDKTGSFDGTTFIAPETGDYRANGAVSVTVASQFGIRAYVNGDGGSVNGFLHYVADGTASSTTKFFNDTIRLNKGDALTFRTSDIGGLTLQNFSSVHYINITKLASPQTMLQTELVAARYTSNNGQSVNNASVNVVNFEDIDYDTHNAVTIGAAWKFTAPLSGYYHVSSNIGFGDIAWTIGEEIDYQVSLNGSLKLYFFVKEWESAVTSTFYRGGSTTLYLNKGDYIDMGLYQNSGASQALNASPAANFISIERIK